MKTNPTYPMVKHVVAALCCWIIFCIQTPSEAYKKKMREEVHIPAEQGPGHTTGSATGLFMC